MLSKAISFGRGAGGDQQLLEVRQVVVAEDLLVAARVADARDHRIVVVGVGQDQAVRNEPGDGRDAGLVGDVAGGEDQRRLLAVQVGELALERDQRMVGARDVARAAGPGAHAGRGLDHGADHLGMLAHAEVVVGAPDHDVARPLRGVPDGVRKSACDTLQLGEHPVAALVVQPAEGVGEERLVVHGKWASAGGSDFTRTTLLEGFHAVCRAGIAPNSGVPGSLWLIAK